MQVAIHKKIRNISKKAIFVAKDELYCGDIRLQCEKIKLKQNETDSNNKFPRNNYL